MATTVTTSTADYATAGGRHTGVTSTGVDWVMLYNLANTRLEFWYSSDDGASWTEATSLRFTVAATEVISSEFYIGEHDRACFAHGGTGGFGLYYTPELTTTATWTTLADSSASLGSNAQVRCRVLDYDATKYHVVIWRNDDGEINRTSYVRLISDDSASATVAVTIATGLAGWFDVDFEHTGDGKTAVTSPATYIVYRDASPGGLLFRRQTHNGTSWANGTFRSLDATAGVATDALCMVFDGSRVIAAYIDNGSDTAVSWVERDAADTATTTRTPTALSDGAITSLSLSFDGEGDTRLYAVGTTSDDVKRLTYDRSAGTFGSWATIEAATATTGTVSVQPGYQGNGLNVVWTTGGSSPYTVAFERDPFNTSPTAATWESPADNSAQDVGQTLTLDWQFNDPDDGDTQSAYALSRSVNGGALAYYNAGAGTWGAGETKNSTTTTSVTLASSWASDGDSVVYKVKTWDFADAEGVYGSGLTIRGSAPVTPVLSSPTDAGTITTASVTVTWSASGQTAYRVRLLTSADAVLYDSGKVTSTATTLVPPTVLADGLTDAKAEVRVWNADDAVGPTDTHTFTVDFVEPATPTYVVTADNTSGYLSIVITDPTPTGSQPTVTSHDVFVRVAAGGRPDGERTVGGDGIRIATGVATGATYLDYAAGSGIDYQYRTLAKADNGTSVYGAWT